MTFASRLDYGAAVLLNDWKLEPDHERLEAVNSVWAKLVTSGTVLTSEERIAVISAARSAWAGGARPNPSDVLADVAYWLATDAGGITLEFVNEVEARGLDRLKYLEAVGVVSILSNIDYYARGLGAPLPELPEPDGSSPTGAVAPDAKMTDSWVPMAGPTFAPGMLDALPAEGEALREIHEPMYLPMPEIGNGAYSDGLIRPQIEYVAARSSFLNECFY